MMRIAIFADIHGNKNALELVLSDIATQHIDKLICLGDVATFGDDPQGCVRLLRGLDCTFVMGNHDDYLIDFTAAQDYRNVESLKPYVDQCLSQLSTADVDFLKTFKPHIELPLDDHHKLFGFHATPSSNSADLLPTASVEELDKLLAGYEANIVVCAHTHMQFYRRIKDTYLLNPGSVGMSFVAYPFQGAPQTRSWAEYAIISSTAAALEIVFRQLPLSPSKEK